MDPATEIASGFTIGDYRALRPSLKASEYIGDAWRDVLKAFWRRIDERFLRPITELTKHDEDDQMPMRPGFAILALDCLLIDTIQAFREGRVGAGQISPALSFKTFLKDGIAFASFSSRDRDRFFSYVRNALLHNGETRGDWRVRIDTYPVLTRDANSGARIINRRLFHAGVLRELGRLCRDLMSEDPGARSQFLRRMDSMCGWPVEPFPHLYFAYGSNLLCSEIARTTESHPVGLAYLPEHRFTFDKHSTTRKCDAANIVPDASRVVWGYVYKVSDVGRELLRQRERGYSEIDADVILVDGHDRAPAACFTFLAERHCEHSCGPSGEYFGLVESGARERGLPEDYLSYLATLRPTDAGAG